MPENRNLAPMIMENTETIKFVKESIPYSETGFYGKMPLDYLSGNENLRPFYGRLPAIESFEEQMVEKSKNFGNRQALVSALSNQYAAAKLKSPALDLLKSDNSFTVTTGHQVCLFTGPLYFFYKIISAINTCKLLKKRHPEKDFIPIFWMATEDHDFEEANHFFLPSGKIEWESGQGGAVGRMKTVGMDEVADELIDKIGIGYTSAELNSLFKKAYVNHENIADATRYLVHQIFGRHGVLVIDADDAELKKLAIPAFEKEICDNISFKEMTKTNQALSDNGFDLQIVPHKINLFYLDEQLRERIEETEDGKYQVVHTNTVFTKEEILKELKAHPEKFSPNVVLRPLLQEIILPNLAYVGGGGELAYWFQLKHVFQAFDVPFPILMLRNSVMVIPDKVKENMDQLGIGIRDLFGDGQKLEDKLVRAETSESLELDNERERLELLFIDMEARLGKINPDLKKSVQSGFARTDRVIKNLEKKMMRAERKKQEILINRLHQVRETLLPRNGLQERNMNFVPLYLEYGSQFIDGLIEVLDPFQNAFSVLGRRS
ncbi:bacillithiol biosynthesis cysteine-adding enzyme BshC [Cryomorpha ignava]|uniref:Putative cysteine ligase BshC n=1 Tax=Cryomorpha ignava TaxID=101383 RepID=A0A7K3WSW9_9FLAO|nr:bacillithiol biosynthesis cysteine-adding enzyme BshC [Cryomorpha ignava]NEN23755.1 bacillithiol biosynthesis cysteine-adding enzyme BshC [Cryomorpha ignava]